MKRLLTIMALISLACAAPKPAPPVVPAPTPAPPVAVPSPAPPPTVVAPPSVAPPARPPVIPVAPPSVPPVTGGDFTITANPSSLSLTPGQSSNVKLTTTITGRFNSSVAFATTVPAGLSSAVSPTSIAAPGNGTATLSIAATQSSASGSRTVLATGVAGLANHSVPITVTVTAPVNVWKVVSTMDAGQFLCFTDKTGNVVNPCPASAIRNDSYRFTCKGSTGKVYANSLTFGPKIANPPFNLWFVSNGPNVYTGAIFEITALTSYPAGVTVDSLTAPRQPKPYTVESCDRGGDFGVQFQGVAGTTETNTVEVYQQGCKATFCDTHGFVVSGQKVLMDDGKPWMAHPSVVAALNAYLAKRPTIDGCKAYPCP